MTMASAVMTALWGYIVPIYLLINVDYKTKKKKQKNN